MSASADRLKAKIAGLRAKTQANGCTEAEALAAAKVAARLMREHDLSEADLVMEESRAPEEATRATWRTQLAKFIAIATNTSAIVLSDRGSCEIVFVGRAPWPEVAIYLRDVCIRAVKAETRAFKEGAFYRRRRTLRTKRQASADFVDALVIRLGCRVIELFEATMDGRAILDARAAVEARFPGSTPFVKAERQSRFHEARSAGWSAGGRVPLSHGVGKPAPRQIPLFEGVE